jgi:spermidine synthase
MAKNKAISSKLKNNIENIVLVCFFSSGISGLIYQILWTRMIVKVIGGAPYAISIILTIFMGGLGLGAYLVSKNIDRIKETERLLKTYGLLELAIGIYAVAIPLLLKGFLPLYGVLYNQLYDHVFFYNFLTFVGVSIILCIPVICMGATLPILCQFYVSSLSHLGTHVGRLYGLNTIGAAVGALLCGFWLIEYWGITFTLLFAVLINCLVGVFCVFVGSKLSPRGSAASEKTSGKASQKKPSNPPLKSVPEKAIQENVQLNISGTSSTYVLNASLVIFAVSGFCAMAYEVIWTKLLGLIVGPTTYSFTIVLVTFITGLGLGSMIFGWIADKIRQPFRLLLATQVAAALSVLIVSQLLGNSQLFFAKLIFSFQDHFAALNLVKALVLFVFMVVPTLCLGATFPLVGKIYTQSVSSVGRSLGFAYMVNTVGAVLGSFIAGFLLIPLLGKENGLSVVIGMQFLVAGVIALMALAKSRQFVLKKYLLVAVALGGVALCFFLPVWNRYGLSQAKYHRLESYKKILQDTGWWQSLFNGSKIANELSSGKIVYYGDGIGGFTTVIKHVNALGRVDFSMHITGKADASTWSDMGTQTLCAHFPMLVHHNPKTVMVLGLASGITAGEVLHHPVDQLDILEISKEVVAASDFFRPWNRNVLDDPRTKLFVQDGRAHLQLTKQRYDVIISEPSNPWMAGLSTLFTEDYFLLARDRLTEEGIFVQFVHGYQMDWPTFALACRTFAKIFPNNLLFRTALGGMDFLMVGFKGQKPVPVLAHADQKIQYIRGLKNVTLNDPKLLYRFIVSEDMQKLFGEGTVHSDAFPRLEYMAPKVMYVNDPLIQENLSRNAWISFETEKIFNGYVKIDQQIDFYAFALSVGMIVSEMACPEGASPSQRKRFFDLVDRYCTHHIPVEPFRNFDVNKRCAFSQIKRIENNINEIQDKALSYRLLADGYQINEDWEKASAYYSKSLQMNPVDAGSHEGLAVTFCERGMMEKCIAEYREALRLKPDLLKSLNNLAWALATNWDPIHRNGAQAVRLAEQACRATDYQSPFALDTLAAAYASAGRYSEAVDAVQKALLLLPETAGESKVATGMRDRLLLYQSGRMYVSPMPLK